MGRCQKKLKGDQSADKNKNHGQFLWNKHFCRAPSGRCPMCSVPTPYSAPWLLCSVLWPLPGPLYFWTHATANVAHLNYGTLAIANTTHLWLQLLHNCDCNCIIIGTALSHDYNCTTPWPSYWPSCSAAAPPFSRAHLLLDFLELHTSRDWGWCHFQDESWWIHPCLPKLKRWHHNP